MKKIVSDIKKSKLFISKTWFNVKKPIGLVKIIGDIQENIETYANLAQFLNKNNYLVLCDIPDARHANCKHDFFKDAVHNEIHILKKLNKKFPLPVFLFGHGYGNFITERIMETPDLCTAGICLYEGEKYSQTTIKLLYYFSWLGCKIYGSQSPAKLFNFIFKANTSDSFSYGFYYSLAKNLLELSYKTNNQTPLLIIGGTPKRYTRNANLAKTLYNAYKSHNMENITIIIYPEIQANLLTNQHYPNIKSDVLSFFNSALSKYYSAHTSAKRKGTTDSKSSSPI